MSTFVSLAKHPTWSYHSAPSQMIREYIVDNSHLQASTPGAATALRLFRCKRLDRWGNQGKSIYYQSKIHLFPSIIYIIPLFFGGPSAWQICRLDEIGKTKSPGFG